MVATWETERNKVPWVKGMRVWKGAPHNDDMKQRIRRNYRTETIKGSRVNINVSMAWDFGA